MSDEALLAAIVLMGGITVVVLGSVAVLYKVPRFDPVKALSLQVGVYQNLQTGQLVEVKAFNENMAYVVDENGGWNVRYDVLDRNYRYVGQL